MMKIRTGLLGGTFDPIHNGHLFLALEAMHLARLDRVLFVPNRVPPHKGAPGADPEQRWAMLALALEGEPRFAASRLELEREGPSYTLDTVEALSQPEEQLVFICGADAFKSPWHRPQAVLERLDNLVIAHRWGVPAGLPAVLEELDPRLKAKVRHLEFPDIAISSTEIRQRVALARPIRYLVPNAVDDYIEEQKLYLPRVSRQGAPDPDEKGSSVGHP